MITVIRATSDQLPNMADHFVKFSSDMGTAELTAEQSQATPFEGSPDPHLLRTAWFTLSVWAEPFDIDHLTFDFMELPND